MARMVKCKICGNKISSDIAYKTVINNKNFYCCSETEFNYYSKEKLAKENLFQYIKIEIFNYKETQILPPIMIKKINEINNNYSYEVIFETIKRLKDNLRYWATRDDKFSSDYQRACYIATIISNKINDIYKEIEKQKKRQEEVNNKPTVIDLDLMNSSSEVIKTKANDISSFLD